MPRVLPEVEATGGSAAVVTAGATTEGPREVGGMEVEEAEGTEVEVEVAMGAEDGSRAAVTVEVEIKP